MFIPLEFIGLHGEYLSLESSTYLEGKIKHFELLHRLAMRMSGFNRLTDEHRLQRFALPLLKHLLLTAIGLFTGRPHLHVDLVLRPDIESQQSRVVRRTYVEPPASGHSRCELRSDFQDAS